MGRVLGILTLLVAAFLCLHSAGQLALGDHAGWGWFLIVALLLFLVASSGFQGEPTNPSNSKPPPLDRDL
jgi:hypothetical protein